MDAPRVKRFSWRDESDRNIRAMDLTVMPGPERFPFDAHTAAQMTESEILKAQLQLETMAFGNLGRFRYALKQMIELERYTVITRKKNKVERGAAKAALSGADAAIDAVFRTAETLANAER